VSRLLKSHEPLRSRPTAPTPNPSYTLAKAFASRALANLTSSAWASDAETQEGVRLAREALAANRDDPDTLRMSAHTLAYLAHEYDMPLVALDRAIALNPNSAAVWGSSGWVRSYIGKTDDAKDHFKRSIRLSPLDSQMGYSLNCECGLALCCLMTGDDAEASHMQDKPPIKVRHTLRDYEH
jgi:adenylate cyclase